MAATTTSSPSTSQPAPRSPLAALRAIGFRREVALVIAIVVVLVIASIFRPQTFPTLNNLQAVMRNLAFDGIMAIGMLLLMVGGVFDLSVGGMFSMAGVIVGSLMNVNGVPTPIAMAVGLSCAALGGFANGLIVAKLKVNALITTLGTMGIFRGIAIFIGGPGINFLPDDFNAIGQSTFLGFQFGVWLLLFLVLLFGYLMTRTRFFRQYYYVGGNQKAALLSGMNVERLQIIGFMISAFLAGLAGIVFASRVESAISIAGDGAELRVVTAVVLGGASLTGGKGNVFGVLLAILFIALIRNVIIVFGIPSTLDQITIGLVLIGALALDTVVNRRRGTA
ncbi:MAG: ABC transporter permease [Anaerolineae bacterium]|nr:ABC transporter permease [Anaerolineae bacterium]